MPERSPDPLQSTNPTVRLFQMWDLFLEYVSSNIRLIKYYEQRKENFSC